MFISRTIELPLWLFADPFLLACKGLQPYFKSKRFSTHSIQNVGKQMVQSYVTANRGSM